MHWHTTSNPNNYVAPEHLISRITIVHTEAALSQPHAQVGEACICRLSHVLESLKDLRHLSLASNQLTNLPISIWKQKGLLFLDLSNNLLTDLPEECAELVSLQVATCSRKL